MKLLVSLLVVITLSPICAFGQLLSDRVPDDAIVFVGWAGSTSMGPKFEQSNLKKLLAVSSIPQLMDDFLPRLMKKIGEKDRNAAEGLQLVGAIGGPMWRHPSAVYFGGMDFSERGHPQPKLALLCDAGDEAAALVEQINKALARAKDSPVPIAVRSEGTLVVVEIGTPNLARTLGGKGLSLATSPKFKEALAKTQADPVALVYGNGQALVKFINEAAAAEGKAQGPEMAGKVIDALGINGLQYAVWTGGFDKTQWTSNLFICAPEPRTGLLALMNAKPLSNEIIQTVPATATFAGVGQLDLYGIFTQIREAIGKFDPNMQQQFDEAVGKASDQLGMEIAEDLLKPIGHEWSVYLDPNVGGNGILGLSIVNRLHDSAKAEESLGKLEAMANKLLGPMLRRQQMTMSFKTTQVSGATIHYFAIPVVTPAWTIKDGNWYLGLYPQVVASAVEQVSSRGKSLADNPDFIALKRDLCADHAPTAVGFLDLPKTAPDGYEMILLVSRLYLGMADLFGVDAPPMVVPQLNKITPLLAPAGGFSWVEADGLHHKSRSPFPGATVLGGGGSIAAVGAGQSAILMSVLMPALNRSRETAMRIKSMSNLRQIGMGIMLYANENKGSYPKDQAELILTQNLTADVFINPGTGKSLPRNLATMTPKQRGAWVNANSDYVYLGAGKTTTTAGPESVIAYEKMEGSRDGVNMLFGDGHVEFKPMFEARKLINTGADKESDGGL